MTEKLVQYVRDQHGQLKGARSVEEGTWSEIFQYTAPRRADFFEKTPGGGQRKRHVLDSTAATACGLAASHLLHAVATPGSDWFDLSVGDGEYDKSGAVAHWRKATVDTVMGHLVEETPLSIYAEFYAYFLDLASIGTAATFTDDRNGQALGRNVPMSELWIDTDFYGVPDTFYRAPRLTYRQARQRWPDFGKDRSVEGHEKADVLAAVVPAKDPYWREHLGSSYPAGAEAVGASHITIELDCTINKILRLGFFHENPYAVARWYTRPGSPYGRSPGQDVLPNMRLVNTAMDTYLRQQGKLADPPILLPAGQMISPLRLFPGAISFSDGEINPQFLIPPGGSRIEFSMELINRAQEDIRRGFFNPFFYNVSGQVKTATQVLQESDDRNRSIAPMLVRIQRELQWPKIRRVMGILQRAGRIQPPPIDGDVVITFKNPTIESQRVTEALATMRFFEGAAAWAQVEPGAFDHVNVDNVVPLLREGFGAPATITHTSAGMKAKRKRREDAEQAQQQQAMALQGAEVMAKVQAAQR